jgi:translocation and assembly module TamB
MKKFLYGFVILFVFLMILIVIAANSSYVIKKAVDTFAPDYNLSYSDISGNVFTGVQINGVKFGDMNITSEIRFSWNPSKILYKHISISEIEIDDIDVEPLKAFIASLPSSDDNSPSEPFPLVVNIEKVHISVMPFTEQGVHVTKSVLDARDVMYRTDEVGVGSLKLTVESNVTNIRLSAAMDEGVLKVDALELEAIDSEVLESMFVTSEEEPSTGSKEDTTPPSPIIPKAVEIAALNVSLKPRKYLDIAIEALNLKAKRVHADILKIIDNKKEALQIGEVRLDMKSDVGDLRILGSLADDTAILTEVDARGIDTLALQKRFVPEHNETNTSSDINTTGEKDVKKAQDTQDNRLIPQKIIVKKFHTDILPAVYAPVHIHRAALDARNLLLDIPSLMVKKGELDLNATTNLSNIKEHSIIRDNHLDGHIVLTPNQRLFELYKLPLRKKAIGDIGIDFTASKERLSVDMKAKAKHILVMPTDSNHTDVNSTEVNSTKPFNIDIDHLHLYGTYLITEKRADADLDLNVTSPYAKESTLQARLHMEGDSLHYDGVMKAGSIEGNNTRLLKPLKGLRVHFKGDEKQLETAIDSKALTGYFNVPDFTQKGMFHLETKAPIEVRDMVLLPAELNTTKVNATIDIPLNFQKLVPIHGKATIRSNVANVDADLVYGKLTHLKLNTVVPKDSLLKHYDKKIQWGAVSPLSLDIKLGETDIDILAKSSKISALMKMKPFDGKVTGNIRLAGMTTTLEGEAPGNIVIHSDVDSFRTLMQTVRSFYAVEGLPKMDGKLNLSLIVSEGKEVYLNILSPEVIYYENRTTTHALSDVSVILKKSGGNVELSSYHLIYNDMTFYSSKPSVVHFKDQTITIPQLWLNNQLKITGELNTKTFKGQIDANAPTFRFAHEWVELDAGVDIQTVFDGNRTDMTGKVTVLDGKILYDLDTKTFPSDSDIIIVQDMKKDQNSTFMDQLTMMIKVDTQKPIVYKQGPVNVEATVDLGIHKALYSDPMIIGSIDIVDGSSYNFQGKVFKLEHSHIYLTGDPAKPMLDLTVKYKALKHMITIVVTGTPTRPNIIFSSVPSLSREQILSLILFDSEEAADTNDANDMMKMMGGAMAKSALNDLGVKIDHLVIGEGNSVEVGKKLTDKTTVIYINGEVPKMEVKYEYSPTIEVVIGASEESESIDVVYTNDFNLK